MPVRTGIPLRKHENGTSAFARRRALGGGTRLCLEIERVHRVVFGIRRVHRARKRQRPRRALHAGPERVIGCVGSLEEALAVRNGVSGPIEQERSGGEPPRATIRLDPVEPPLERPHHAILAGGVKPPLPCVKQSCDH